MQTTYRYDPYNVLPNGLTFLQADPNCAAQLDASAPDFGYLFVERGGSWVKFRSLSPLEIEEAQDQAADMRVLVPSEQTT